MWVEARATSGRAHAEGGSSANGAAVRSVACRSSNANDEQTASAPSTARSNRSAPANTIAGRPAGRVALRGGCACSGGACAEVLGLTAAYV